jgi:biopolymer transport protein ExbD
MAITSTFRRKRRRVARIALTPLVDVMLILLIFFMVTSTYLDIGAMPMVKEPETGDAPGSSGEPRSGSAGSAILFLRLSADGTARGPGFAVPIAKLPTVADRLASYERVAIILSGGLTLQTLVDVLDTLAAMDLKDVSFVRVGGER